MNNPLRFVSKAVAFALQGQTGLALLPRLMDSMTGLNNQS